MDGLRINVNSRARRPGPGGQFEDNRTWNTIRHASVIRSFGMIRILAYGLDWPRALEMVCLRHRRDLPCADRFDRAPRRPPNHPRPAGRPHTNQVTVFRTDGVHDSGLQTSSTCTTRAFKTEHHHVFAVLIFSQLHTDPPSPLNS